MYNFRVYLYKSIGTYTNDNIVLEGQQHTLFCSYKLVHEHMSNYIIWIKELQHVCIHAVGIFYSYPRYYFHSQDCFRFQMKIGYSVFVILQVSRPKKPV